MLEFGSKPPMSAGSLVDHCVVLLHPTDLDDLKRVVVGRLTEVGDPAVRAYAQRDVQLRNAVAKQRAGRAGADASRYLQPHQGWDVEVEDVAAQAMSAGDPLERELMLDRFRWRLLEQMAALPAFGVQALHSYALRLRLLEKWQALTEERGTAVAGQIIDSTIAEISV